MYLSKLTLNPYAKPARRDLANPYAMHATLCWAFEKSDEEMAAEPKKSKTVHDFLWRLEPMRRGASAVLIQSSVVPDWDKLLTRTADYLSEVPETKPLPLKHLELRQILRFRLKANPTVTRNGKRHGLSKHGDLLGEYDEQGKWKPGWLERQASKNGFQLLNTELIKVERLSFTKHSGGSPVTLQSALFEGKLQITELKQFRSTVEKGLGKAKGLGFGLLSVAKPRG